jgi:D-alanyl-D-alanine dipeptidase
MINLPDYMGKLCSYEITNSYGSVFKVHDYAIPGVTGIVVKGYEHMQQKNGEFLVPLLYPAAKKLAAAGEAALEQGYRLKIYEAFRPREATLSVYDLTQAIVQNMVPQHPEGLTFEQLMTDNGRYALSNFLAKGISNHNRGIALDLTLETLNGVELPMQTSIHDLSWYSEPAANNENATALREIMTGAGLTTLDSEWWHFQDEEAKQNLTQMKPLEGGVNARCWVRDNTGWRYRTEDGSWLKDCIWQLDGISYSFDDEGYATMQ